MQKTSQIVANEINGIFRGIEIIQEKQFALFDTNFNNVVWLDCLCIPGGTDWLKKKVGKRLHIRLIGRELIPNAST